MVFLVSTTSQTSMSLSTTSPDTMEPGTGGTHGTQSSLSPMSTMNPDTMEPGTGGTHGTQSSLSPMSTMIPDTMEPGTTLTHMPSSISMSTVPDTPSTSTEIGKLTFYFERIIRTLYKSL